MKTNLHDIFKKYFTAENAEVAEVFLKFSAFSASSAVIFLLLSLLISGCAGLPGLLAATDTPGVTSTPPPTGTPTPTIVWFPPTKTPTPGPSYPTPAPTAEMRPNVGEVAIEDDFSSQSGWQAGAMSGGTVAYGPGSLSIAIPDQAATLVSLRSAPVPENYYLEITASASLCRGKDAYGLVFRSEGWQTGYRWIISCDGQTRVERWRPAEAAVVHDWSYFGEGGAPLSLRLGLWLWGSEMRFFIDGVYLFSARDPLLVGTQVGVFARAAGQNALSVSFSNLVVRSIVGFQPTPIPSPTPWVTVTNTRAPTWTPGK
jgi:hypothetical protein